MVDKRNWDILCWTFEFSPETEFGATGMDYGLILKQSSLPTKTFGQF